MIWLRHWCCGSSNDDVYETVEIQMSQCQYNLGSDDMDEVMLV